MAIETVFKVQHVNGKIRRKPKPVRIIHDDITQCQFGKGRIHKTFVTDAQGNHFVDSTLVQRCPCGERKVTRVSRKPIE